MSAEDVRVWRPADEDRVLLMAGRTTRYAVDPRDEYVFGVVAEQAMRSRRGHERRLVAPGQVVAWDPSGPHSGSAVDGQAWSARLLVVGSSDLAALAGAQEATVPAEVSFPEPVLTDVQLAVSFLRLHVALEASTSRLERDEQLAEWLRAVVERWSPTPAAAAPLHPRDGRALQLAYDFLGDEVERNVSLDELAAITGADKFRLLRLFRDRVGLPPHALQMAHRVRRARRLLEAGESIAEVAVATGFSDQSHLHRQFRRSLGMTPGEYQRRVTGR